jgi:hypothetical protein
MRHALTEHAAQRAQQRAACMASIEATIAYGAEYRQPGRSAYYLGRRQVNAALRFGVDLKRFERTAVVVADDGAIITVIRASSTKKIRRVPDYRASRYCVASVNLAF